MMELSAGQVRTGFLRHAMNKAMVIALAEIGIFVETQKPVIVHFRGKAIGNYYADLLIERKVLVELKAVKALKPEHHAQVINYLKATDIEVGLLINFGNPKLEFKRFTRRKNS